MDPNANLARQRVVQGYLREAGENVERRMGLLTELCQLTEALDHWLTGGGFLPAPWAGAKYGFRPTPGRW
jgi:hypothetical protein